MHTKGACEHEKEGVRAQRKGACAQQKEGVCAQKRKRICTNGLARVHTKKSVRKTKRACVHKPAQTARGCTSQEGVCAQRESECAQERGVCTKKRESVCVHGKQLLYAGEKDIVRVCTIIGGVRAQKKKAFVLKQSVRVQKMRVACTKQGILRGRTQRQERV